MSLLSGMYYVSALNECVNCNIHFILGDLYVCDIYVRNFCDVHDVFEAHNNISGYDLCMFVMSMIF